MRYQLSIPVTAMALFALAACGTQTGSSSSDGGASVAPDVPLTGTRWSVDSVTVDGRRTAAPDGAYVELTEKGRAQGNYGCNHFGADVSVEGDTVTVGPGEMTEMGCEQRIQGFEDALRAALTGKLKAGLSDGRLTLTTADGDTVALSAEKPAPLVGTTWTVDSLVTGESAASLPAGPEKKAELKFTEDGKVGGSLGCNRFSATAKIADGSITFGPVSATRKLCPGPEMELERELTALLAKGTLAYEVKHRALTLTAPDGEGVGAVAAAR
ncbi:META domain-containing protein [Streptomyces zhihengii]